MQAWLCKKLDCAHQAADLAHDTFVSLLAKPCAPDQPRAYLLSQIDGLTYADIAAELGVSVSRVRQYMAQALARCYVAL